MIREILLTQNKTAIIDDEDYELVSQYKWHVLVAALEFFGEFANLNFTEVKENI